MSVKKVAKKTQVKKATNQSDHHDQLAPANKIPVAKWMVENTSLTFNQIALSTGLDIIEVKAIADGFAGNSAPNVNPVLRGYFLEEDIKNAEQDQVSIPSYIPNVTSLFTISNKASKSKYTPVVVRYNRISAAMWIFNEFPKVPAPKVIKFLSIAKNIAESIKSKTYKNVYNLEAKDPVLLNLCTTEELAAFTDENKSYKLSNQ